MLDAAHLLDSANGLLVSLGLQPLSFFTSGGMGEAGAGPGARAVTEILADVDWRNLAFGLNVSMGQRRSVDEVRRGRASIQDSWAAMARMRDQLYILRSQRTAVQACVTALRADTDAGRGRFAGNEMGGRVLEMLEEMLVSLEVSV